MKIGDRVKMTRYGKEQFPKLKSFTGVIVDCDLETARIQIKRDGLKTLYYWHPLFWRKARR